METVNGTFQSSSHTRFHCKRSKGLYHSLLFKNVTNLRLLGKCSQNSLQTCTLSSVPHNVEAQAGDGSSEQPHGVGSSTGRVGSSQVFHRFWFHCLASNLRRREAESKYSAHVPTQEKVRPLMVTLKNLGRAQHRGCSRVPFQWGFRSLARNGTGVVLGL